MKPARNDPCACGSGKKYKKCCLPKEQEAVIAARRTEQLQQKTATVPSAQGARKVHADSDFERIFDAHDAALTRCWRNFEAADYEGRFQHFLDAIEQPEVLDDELALDMLTEIYSASIKRNERERIEPLLDTLQARLPEVYEAAAHEYLAWRIETALTLARQDRILPLARALGERAHKDFDHFVVVSEQLAYHGQLPALLVAMPAAYPQVHDNDEILPWGQEEFFRKARKFVMFDYLERNRALDLNDPDFLQALQQYGPIEPTKLASVMGHLSGRRQGAWTVTDFEPETTYPTEDDHRTSNEPEAATLEGRLHLLCLEFIGYLHRQLGMPYTKADLGASELYNYLVKRCTGAFPRKSPAPKAGARTSKKTKSSKPQSLLCPDPSSLRRYLEQADGILLNKQYSGGAALEIIPAWISYLHTRGLCEVSAADSVIAAMRPVCQERIKRYKLTLDDPLLPQNLSAAYERPE